MQNAILNKDREIASSLAQESEEICKVHLKKSFFLKSKDYSVAFAVALTLAFFIRQTWWENYEIPSGSMRPTLMEKDKLVVSKTQFGINIPLRAAHMLFEPENVKRMGMVAFTGEGMPIPNVHTRYFYIFPGVKQFVKRVIGKPGDTLYFYGGKIYGIDAAGNDLTEELQKEELSYLEHIPFIHLEGKLDVPRQPLNDLYSPVVHEQSGIPLAELFLKNQHEVHHKILQTTTPNLEMDIHDFWGINNFANARILKYSELKHYPSHPENSLPFAKYYLELTHHPSAKKSHIQKDQFFRIRPKLDIERSFIPLTDEHMQKIWNSIYTTRIVFEDGHFHRWGMSKQDVNRNSFLPQVSGNIENGTYEFLSGELYKVGLGGISEKLSKDHPLQQYSSEKCYTFYNIGIECDNRFITRSSLGLTASRYAYFRNGDLYLMGQPILSKDDPNLQEFLEKEERHQKAISNYFPFIDNGPPLKKDGSLNKEFIQTYGLKVPEKRYYVLGDNHAVSNDSREFGFVPEDNLRGVPSFIFFAPNNRYGFPNNGLYPIFTTSRLIIWVIYAIFFSIWGFFHYRKNKLPLSF